MSAGVMGWNGYSGVRIGWQVEPTGDYPAGQPLPTHSVVTSVAIADRCLQRLNKKGNRLLLAGKHPNKVKVACAREMVGLVWESLNLAAAA